MAYSVEELSRIVDQLRVRLDETTLEQSDDPAEKFTYAGPGYPRITRVRPGVRQVDFDANNSFQVKELYAPQLAGGKRPPVYPAVVEVDDKFRDVYFSPGAVTRVKKEEMDADKGRGYSGMAAILPYLTVVKDEEVEEVREFSGNSAFYFHPEDTHLPVTERRAAQGPVPGDPDAHEPRYDTGAGKSEGYVKGTQANPYRPWQDPDSKYFGWPVKTP